MGLLIATLYLKVYDSNQMGSTFDPNKFKMDQLEGWNSVAEGWKEWWEPIEKGAQEWGRHHEQPFIKLA